MKATKIYYKKLFNLGNFSNEEIGIEIEIEPGEKAIDALNNARNFVESKGDPAKLINDYEYYKSIVENPDNYKYSEVIQAKKFLEKIKSDEDLPF